MALAKPLSLAKNGFVTVQQRLPHLKERAGT
jgi:hypothetical protein